MRFQYSVFSVRVGGRQSSHSGGWQQGTLAAGDAAGFVGGIRGNIRFFSHPVVCRKLMRIGLILFCTALLCNLSCSFLIDSTDLERAALQQRQVTLEMTNIKLLAKRAVAWGPDNLQQLVTEKNLDLAPAGKDQIVSYDHHRKQFRY